MKTKTYEPLDELIDKTGLKYDFVAENLGISRNRLDQMRVAPMTMNIYQMEQLAKILQVTFLDIYSIQKI